MTKRERISIIVIFLLPIVICLGVATCRYLAYQIIKNIWAPPVIFTAFRLNEEIYSDYDFQRIVEWTTQGKFSRLPNDSKNIFACNDHNRDPAFWLTFELPKEKIPHFVEKVTGVRLEELVNGIFSRHLHINEGPRSIIDRCLLGQSYWDLNEVEKGRHYEKGVFYCGVDVERGKIFLCHWTM